MSSASGARNRVDASSTTSPMFLFVHTTAPGQRTPLRRPASCRQHGSFGRSLGARFPIPLSTGNRPRSRLRLNLNRRTSMKTPFRTGPVATASDWVCRKPIDQAMNRLAIRREEQQQSVNLGSFHALACWMSSLVSCPANQIVNPVNVLCQNRREFLR